jgi:hypothetical protein
MALTDLTAPAVRHAMNEFDRIGREAFLSKYAIGKARGFWIVHEDKAYDSKALAGAAHGYIPGHKPLGSGDFSGGEATVARVLTNLGFGVEVPTVLDQLPTLDVSVSRYDDGPSPPIRPVNKGVPRLRGDDYRQDNAIGTDRQKWFYRELARIYLFTKSLELPIAFKAVNGSYRLDAGNIGHAVKEGMLEQLHNEKLVETIRLTPAFLSLYGGLTEPEKEDPISAPEVNDDYNQHVVPPPSPTVPGLKRAINPVLSNWAERDDRNRKLGAAGEEWVVRWERRRLKAAKRKELASRIRHVSKEIGDGLGYDIESFDVNGSSICIEVKTTNRGISAPFLVSNREIDASKEMGQKFRLYRVFEFHTGKPRVYILEGPLNEKCEFTPVSYRAIPL